MTDNNKLSKLRLTLITAALATGFVSIANTAAADDSNVSEKDMLAQAVALYEKLSSEEVTVPDALLKDCGDENLGKAVILGFKNTDEISSVSDAVTIRKQDALTILYKTIISYDYSYALSSEEIDEIMNGCYDNALIDEENRAAYAFMLKHDIVIGPFDTEPNKLITWSSCSTLVDVIYDMFVQNVTFNVNGNAIKIGTNAETVIDTFGKPDRTDKSDYGFDWYVYNSDPTHFMMVGVKEDRICAFFSNSSDFAFGDLKNGDDYLLAYKYTENDDFRIFKNSDGTIDALLYNPYTKSDVTAKNSTYLRACELIDIINANRAKSGLDTLNIDNDLYAKASDMVSQAKYRELARDGRYSPNSDGGVFEEGYDVFLIYQKLIESDSECFNKDIKSIGVSTYTDEGYNIYAGIVCSDKSAELTTQPTDIETVEPGTVSYTENPQSDEFVFETPDDEEPTADIELVTPSVSAPQNEAVVPAGTDLTIELAESVSDEYYVSIYSIEDDKYIVNSFIKTADTKLSFTKDLFTTGKDYTISISSATSTSASEPVEFTVRYGEVPENALTLVTPETSFSTDDDTIAVKWQTELYSNFVLDVYDTDGKLMLSEIITDTDNVTINNVDPGTYYVYLTALREGTEDVFKAQAMATVDVTLPEPVITEHILEDGEKFYPVYEDSEMGLLYFYDEDIIDVEEISSNGKAVTVKKKKITEKQVKDVSYYRSLAATINRVECFIGSQTPTLITENIDTYSYSGSQMSIYDDTMGNAVVNEAKKYLGIPYVWGGTSTSGFDCSGLVQYVYKNLGVTLNRVSQDQYKQGMPLTREQLMPGDLVFFEKDGDVHHVGIYVGNGYMIHAPYTGAVVSYQSIDTPYYKSQFCGGRRVY